MKKSTDELQKELSSVPNLTRFLAANQEQLDKLLQDFFS